MINPSSHPLSLPDAPPNFPTYAFAAAVGKVTALRNPRLSEALRTGIIFGVIEAVTPLIGWALGSIAAEFVADWDHWIAFALLLVLGALMIRTGLRADEPEATPAIRHSFWLLAATGFATSIDRKSTRLNSSH